jgi:tetratricopeptide (TPR) repeat protein
VKNGLLLALTCIFSLCAQSQSKPAGGQLPELSAVDASGFQTVIRTQIENAERAARIQPRDPEAAGLLAMTLHAYQQYDRAARAYARASQLEPQNFDWHYLRGAVQVELGDFNAAVESFRSALRLRPHDLAAGFRLAQSLAALARWDEAAGTYRRILDEHHDCARAWYGLGRVQAAQGDHAGAAQSYAQACNLFPAYGGAHFALAAELRRLGRRAEAEAHIAEYSKDPGVEPPLDDPLFKRIRELNQGTQVHLQRGMELEKAGLLEDAIREHEAALAIDPANEQVHVNLISLYGRTGNPDKAKQHFSVATKLNPGRSDAWYNYGVLLFQERNYEGAEKAFRQAVTINPDYGEAHNNLGAIYEQQGRLDDAEREFRQAIAGQPNYALAHFHLGRILVNRLQYDEAIQQFLRALQPESEQTPVYLYALAATYSRAGDREHALTYFHQARDGALARGQSQLVSSIDRDLKTLGSEP